MTIWNGGAKAALCVMVSAVALAQGGPPFISDDPDTPGNGHWEINMGYLGERGPAGGSYQTPDIDINYGVGSRIQLKYELPWTIEETTGESGRVAAGLGNSLLGVKWRFYQRHVRNYPRETDDIPVRVSFSLYPQLALNNPTRSVARGVVDPGPQVYLPLEASMKVAWIRVSAEGGYWITSKDVPNSWTNGLVVGHEFQRDTELYVELYNQRDIRVRAGQERFGESTLGLGGRVPIVRAHWLRFIGMGGHGLVAATPQNRQPTWIAYVGLQYLSDKRRRHGDEPGGD